MILIETVDAYENQKTKQAKTEWPTHSPCDCPRFDIFCAHTRHREAEEEGDSHRKPAAKDRQDIPTTRIVV